MGGGCPSAIILKTEGNVVDNTGRVGRLEEEEKMDSGCLLNYDVLSVGEEHRVYLLARVKGGSAQGEKEPRPINLSLVIDRSGSMKGDKIEYVKEAAAGLVRRLGEKDTLSVVAYDDVIEIPIQPERVKDKDTMVRAIRALTARNMTNLSGGWLQGCQFVAETRADDQVNRVLLLSDGLANQGVTEPGKLAAMTRQKRSEGITTTTMGVGEGFNEDLMTRMAVEGGGAFYFIDSPDKAPEYFNEELEDLLNVVGQNLTVTFEINKHVKGVNQLYDYPFEQRGDALLYRLGDLYSEEERYQVFELTLAPLKKGETKLGTVTISFDEMLEDEIRCYEEAIEIVVQALPEKQIKVKLPNVDVEKVALIQRAARTREKAVELADAGRFEEAAKLLKEMADLIDASEIEDEELQKVQDMLREEAADLEMGRERYDAVSRKLYHMKHGPSSHRHRRHLGTVEEMHLRSMERREATERRGRPPAKILWLKKELVLKDHSIGIGSAPDNEIVLDDPLVAAHHIHIEPENGGWMVHSLQGPENVHLNSAHLRSRLRLSAGDVLRVGGVVLRFE